MSLSSGQYKEVTSNQIASALNFLDCNCNYSEWIKSGMAIHSWSAGNDGFCLWDTAISMCIFAGYDPKQTLVKVIEKFGGRMEVVKKLTKEHDLLNLKDQPIEFLLELWREAKKQKN